MQKSLLRSLKVQISDVTIRSQTPKLPSNFAAAVFVAKAPRCQCNYSSCLWPRFQSDLISTGLGVVVGDRLNDQC